MPRPGSARHQFVELGQQLGLAGRPGIGGRRVVAGGVAGDLGQAGRGHAHLLQAEAGAEGGEVSGRVSLFRTRHPARAGA